jgi:hypothetical protein
MPTCPAGHDSTDADFCDVCGMRIGGSAPAATPGPVPASAGAGQAEPAPAAPDAGAEPCPQCGTARSGQFCEVCGYDFASGKPAAPSPAEAAAAPAATGAVDAGTAPAGSTPAVGTAPGDGGDPAAAGSPAAVWTAVVTADRAYYDRVIAEGGPDAATIEFPGYCPERRFRLSGQEMRIGRRSVSRGLEPEIDLTGPPTDPGVSHLHAVLMAEPDGGWAVLDPGSANGTFVNDGEIAAGVRVPLHDGDRVCVGAWTVLTIRATSGP